MKRVLTAGILSLALCLPLMQGCKTVSATGQPGAPTLTFAQGTNASLQAAHKFGMDISSSVATGKLVLSPAEQQAFNAFAVSLNATDAIYIQFESGAATRAQVSAALANTTALQATAQSALAQGGK